MSRTRHAERKRRAGVGRDYWSRRFPSMVMPWGAYGKHRTHRYERHLGKMMEKEGE